MNRRIITLLVASMLISAPVVYSAKYTVNKTGTVKNQAGQTITSPANYINQNYYNNERENYYLLWVAVLGGVLETAGEWCNRKRFANDH